MFRFRYYCYPEYSYIVTGGLGGFGLELTDWLVTRGARKIVLSSRTGVQTGYQDYKIRSLDFIMPTLRLKFVSQRFMKLSRFRHENLKVQLTFNYCARSDKLTIF